MLPVLRPSPEGRGSVNDLSLLIHLTPCYGGDVGRQAELQVVMSTFVNVKWLWLISFHMVQSRASPILLHSIISKLDK
jgi:hypothetical protein